MSDIREARAIRYLLDAANDTAIIGPALEEGLYSMAIFHAQQASEKSAKACLSLLNILITDEHIYTDYLVKFVIPESKDLNKDFMKLLPDVNKLESYYIPSRYGVDRFGKIHYRKYDEKEVRDLCKSSVDFLELCFKFIEDKSGRIIPRRREELEQFFVDNYYKFIRELR
ncbi:HEPN domain protein [uncultured archaeon]|nr:HEPN domain protein [uncultured archaeon]